MEEKDIRNHETINELLRIITLEQKENANLKQQLEDKEAIIKEVKEYIGNREEIKDTEWHAGNIEYILDILSKLGDTK